jgi:uncharacterized protein (TIGR03066 family)
MRILGCVLVAGVGLVLIGCGGRNNTSGSAATGTSGGSTPKAVDAKMVHGTWKLVKAEEEAQAPPVGTELEFTADGKCRMFNGGKGSSEGTYTPEANKLIMKYKALGQEPTKRFTILDLTATDLVWRTDPGFKEE